MGKYKRFSNANLRVGIDTQAGSRYPFRSDVLRHALLEMVSYNLASRSGSVVRETLAGTL